VSTEVQFCRSYLRNKGSLLCSETWCIYNYIWK